MKWFRNLSIRIKILLMFVPVLCMTLAQATTAIGTLGGIHGQMENVENAQKTRCSKIMKFHLFLNANKS